MSAPHLKVGPLTIPHLARVDALTQSYEPIGGQSVFRALSGLGINQMTWQKTRIVTSGSGWMPPALETLDYSQSMVLACVAPLALYLPPAETTATLPVKRRADQGAEPWAVALYPHGASHPAALALSGNIATVTPEADAIGYQVFYYPQFEVIALRPRQSGDPNSAIFGWELICEEQ
jgi:hypothetical protein